MTTLSRILVVTLVLTVAVTAFAGNSAHMKLNAASTINGQEFAPGDYKLSWTGSGDNVQVTISRDNKAVATVPATLVEQPQVPLQDSLLLQEDNGARNVIGVRFAGKKTAIQFNNGATASRGQ